ncbi:MAG: DUF202 domain-containing protein [Phenylobacterium sp.]
MNAASEQVDIDHNKALIDADRLLMQIIQTSISLIGFGFTINAFFNDVAVKGLAVDADETARRLGLALLCLGLIFLSMGTWNQARYRHGLWERYRSLGGVRGRQRVHRYSAAPSILLALLLLVVGLGALASILLRMMR